VGAVWQWSRDTERKSLVWRSAKPTKDGIWRFVFKEEFAIFKCLEETLKMSLILISHYPGLEKAV
jgi:hypothetical protein